mmetsp:Transcript_78594/g.225204  ORF Transcript_78594/g.225204 Transcript_78594/m.225204 type:complete len:233 (-) Transcript_78594:360-1058(-)
MTSPTCVSVSACAPGTERPRRRRRLWAKIRGMANKACSGVKLNSCSKMSTQSKKPTSNNFSKRCGTKVTSSKWLRGTRGNWLSSGRLCISSNNHAQNSSRSSFLCWQLSVMRSATFPRSGVRTPAAACAPTGTGSAGGGAPRNARAGVRGDKELGLEVGLLRSTATAKGLPRCTPPAPPAPPPATEVLVSPPWAGTASSRPTSASKLMDFAEVIGESEAENLRSKLPRSGSL